MNKHCSWIARATRGRDVASALRSAWTAGSYTRGLHVHFAPKSQRVLQQLPFQTANPALWEVYWRQLCASAVRNCASGLRSPQYQAWAAGLQGGTATAWLGLSRRARRCYGGGRRRGGHRARHHRRGWDGGLPAGPLLMSVAVAAPSPDFNKKSEDGAPVAGAGRVSKLKPLEIPVLSYHRMLLHIMWLLMLFLPMGFILMLHTLRLVPQKWVYNCLSTSLTWAGPTFIKLGQWIATRPDVFSEALCSHLSCLHTDSPVSPTPCPPHVAGENPRVPPKPSLVSNTVYVE